MRFTIALLALLFTHSAWAQSSCPARLVAPFTPAQAAKLCSEFGSAYGQSIVPSASATYDLGSSTRLWRDAYLSRSLIMSTSGGTISLQEATGATACMGVATPNGNTNVTVTTSCAASGARVFFSRVGAITNMGTVSVTTAPAGANFTFASTSATDTLASSVVWMIIKEAA